MKRTAPPFRADHVGSLLRPAFLLEAREQLEAGTIDEERFAEVEDAAVDEALALQHQRIDAAGDEIGGLEHREDVRLAIDRRRELDAILIAGARLRDRHANARITAGIRRRRRLARTARTQCKYQRRHREVSTHAAVSVSRLAPTIEA